MLDLDFKSIPIALAEIFLLSTPHMKKSCFDFFGMLWSTGSNACNRAFYDDG